MNEDGDIKEGQVICSPLFNEPMRVETARSVGSMTCVLGLVGTQSERFRKVTLTEEDLKLISIVIRACRKAPSAGLTAKTLGGADKEAFRA